MTATNAFTAKSFDFLDRAEALARDAMPLLTFAEPRQ